MTAATMTPQPVKRAKEPAGGLFRVLVGEHIDDGPKGCECPDCLMTKGKSHRYRARRYDRRTGASLDPEDYTGDLVESKVDLELRFNAGPNSRKFERVVMGAPPVVAAPPVVNLDKLSLAQLLAIAAEEEVDVKGSAKREEVLKALKAAGVGLAS